MNLKQDKQEERPVIPWPCGVAGVVVAVAGLWAYWPILVELERTWARQPDYSHGYLVAPLAACFLWARRDRRPKVLGAPAWPGLLLVIVGCAMRVMGAWWYARTLESWSLPICLAGAVWFLAGRAWFRWSLPAFAFLLFMLPLPYSAERNLSQPLQYVATQASCWLLECLGEPTINEGNVIVMHDTRLLVAEACSGMRIFVSILALSYAYVVLLKRPWWCKLCLVLSVLPIALGVNVLRITITGLLSVYLSGATAHHFAHDVSGWAMLPVAALLLAMVPYYMSHLIVEAETANPPHLFSRPRRGQVQTES